MGPVRRHVRGSLPDLPVKPNRDAGQPGPGVRTSPFRDSFLPLTTNTSRPPMVSSSASPREEEGGGRPGRPKRRGEKRRMHCTTASPEAASTAEPSQVRVSLPYILHACRSGHVFFDTMDGLFSLFLFKNKNKKTVLGGRLRT